MGIWSTNNDMADDLRNRMMRADRVGNRSEFDRDTEGYDNEPQTYNSRVILPQSTYRSLTPAQDVVLQAVEDVYEESGYRPHPILALFGIRR
jgi:hypothetical protein